MGVKSLLHNRLLGFALFKENYSYVFESEMYLIGYCNDYACKCMLVVCGSISFPLFIVVYVLQMYFNCYEFIICIWGKILEAPN